MKALDFQNVFIALKWSCFLWIQIGHNLNEAYFTYIYMWPFSTYYLYPSHWCNLLIYKLYWSISAKWELVTKERIIKPQHHGFCLSSTGGWWSILTHFRICSVEGEFLELSASGWCAIISNWSSGINPNVSRLSTWLCICSDRGGGGGFFVFPRSAEFFVVLWMCLLNTSTIEETQSINNDDGCKPSRRGPLSASKGWIFFF